MTELSEEKLLKKLKEIATDSYSPYSHFKVAALVLTEGGKVYGGTNVENASYGLTICAERSAIFAMCQTGDRKIAAVYIYTPTATPSAPCGACRQVIWEFGPTAEVISFCDTEKVLRKPIGLLLPDAFGPSDLATQDQK